MSRFALLLGIALLALSFGGCNSRITRSDVNPEVTRVHLGGTAGGLFRKLTGAKAMTLSENLAVYGHEDPPSALLACHEESENGHAGQAKVIGDVLVEIGAIDDDSIGRGCAWEAIYACEWLQRGYEGNRFERGAREACRHLEK